MWKIFYIDVHAFKIDKWIKRKRACVWKIINDNTILWEKLMSRALFFYIRYPDSSMTYICIFLYNSNLYLIIRQTRCQYERATSGLALFMVALKHIGAHAEYFWQQNRIHNTENSYIFKGYLFFNIRLFVLKLVKMNRKILIICN